VTKASELAHLFRSLKARAAARALPKLAERARDESWGYERFAERCSPTALDVIGVADIDDVQGAHVALLGAGDRLCQERPAVGGVRARRRGGPCERVCPV
jgi:hypothetical protein